MMAHTYDHRNPYLDRLTRPRYPTPDYRSAYTPQGEIHAETGGNPYAASPGLQEGSRTIEHAITDLYGRERAMGVEPSVAGRMADQRSFAHKFREETGVPTERFRGDPAGMMDFLTKHRKNQADIAKAYAAAQPSPSDILGTLKIGDRQKRLNTVRYVTGHEDYQALTDPVERERVMNDALLAAEGSESGIHIRKRHGTAATGERLEVLPGPDPLGEDRPMAEAPGMAIESLLSGRGTGRGTLHEGDPYQTGGAALETAKREALPEQARTPGGIASPKSRAEHDALPSGAKYRDPMGNVRRKP